MYTPIKERYVNYEFNSKTELYKFIFLQTAKQLSQFMEYERLTPFPGKRVLIMPWHSSIHSTPHTFSRSLFLYFPNVIRGIKSRIMKWEGMQQMVNWKNKETNL
jgi:hypothetical protein